MIEQTFDIVDLLDLACKANCTFFTSEQPKIYNLESCQKSRHYLLDNIFIRLGSELYRQIVGSWGTRVEIMLILAPKRYTAGFCIVAKVILWCI